MKDSPSVAPRCRRLTGPLLPAVTLVALAAACFARLASDPTGLIVDGSRPSVDYANRGDPRPIGNDLVYLFLPHHESIARRIAQFGHWPVWDARGFGGRPLAGNPQAGMAYPPTWLAWWLRTPAILGWLTVAHLLWGGMGAYVLVRCMGSGRWAATVAAGVYQASPYLMAHTFEGHYPHVWAASWYPWAFWAYRQHRDGRSRGLLIVPILAATYLTGHPQEWLMLVIALTACSIRGPWSVLSVVRGPWSVVRCGATAPRALAGPPRWPRFPPASPAIRVSEQRTTDNGPRTNGPRTNGPRTNGPRTNGPRTIAGWLGVLVLSVGIAGVDAAPQYLVRPWLRRDHSPGLDFGIPHRYHLGGLNAFQLLGPTALGGPSDYFGDDNYWESVFSIGLIPLVLAVLAVMRHPDRRLVRGWLVLTALAVAFACGRALGFYPLCYATLPGIGLIRVPARSLFLANLGGAVLAGLGIQTLQMRMASHAAWRRSAWRLGSAGIVVIGVLVLVQRGRTTGPDHPPAKAMGAVSAPLAPPGSGRAARAASRVLGDKRFWSAIGGMMVLIGVGCGPIGARRRRGIVGLVGLFALGELGWYGYALIQVAPAERFVGPDPVSAALPANRRPPVRIKARDAFYGDLPASLSGIEKTNVNDAFQLDRAAALYETLYPVASRARPMAERLLNASAKDAWQRIRQAVFDRMSVEFLVSDREETDPPWPVAVEGMWDGSRFVIQRNASAMPRAYVVPRATVLPDHRDVVLSALAGLDPRQSVVMTADPLAGLRPGTRQAFAAAEWTSTDPDRPALLVTTQAPGLLVVADSWMPGWTATMNGRPARVLRGNYAQRVIPIPEPGRHVIVMEYHPPGLVLGCVLSVGSVLAWVVLIALRVVGRYRARSDPGPSNSRVHGTRFAAMPRSDVRVSRPRQAARAAVSGCAQTDRGRRWTS
jgi:hypothetical protein